MIVLKKDDYQKILDHAKAELPNEACGLIGGKIEGENQIITDIYLLTNIDHSPEHFSMDPKEQLEAVKDIRAKGNVLLGNFHSHPETPSRPSEEDIRLSFDSKAHYLILSLMEENNPVLNSFHVEKGVVTKENLVIQ
ncbi:MAG: M67 family metallopeptidase [Lachnospiraceae bacterium]